MRLDKWLWCVRFFKTRALAAAAIKGGKIQVNQDKPKPAKNVSPSDTLHIRRGPFTYVIEVTGLPRARLGAAEAAKAYIETPASQTERERLAAELKASAQSMPVTDGRPSKRQRRQIIKFRTNWNGADT